MKEVRTEKATQFRRASFRVTPVGFSSTEAIPFQAALRRRSGSLELEIKSEARVSAMRFPLETVHAIVFTPTSLESLSVVEEEAVRAAMEPGTCRAYLLVPAGSAPPSRSSPLDDFIQMTYPHDCDAVAARIIAFFREADDLNRRSSILSLRDTACHGAYEILKFLWPVSYGFALFHTVNAIAILVCGPPSLDVLRNPYVVTLASFFGLFFVAHRVHVVVRNVLYALLKEKGIFIHVALCAGITLLGVAATGYSVFALDKSALRLFVISVVAVIALLIYLYARRIRAEITSLSELQAAMKDAVRRTKVLEAVKRLPITAASFTLFAPRSRRLFISYTNASEWSSRTAALIHRWTKDDGYEVFLDRSSIPSGSLWRQLLLRGLSECSCFVAVLEGQTVASVWTLAESIYAMTLRKNIGKPRILLVVSDHEGLLELMRGPFGAIYSDVFLNPPERRHGAAILVVGQKELTSALILRAIKEVPTMGLLC